jgi:RHO1 GDP-GTP exchange protein 1/2
MYPDLGCFVTKHGIPSRKCGYVRWETKAESFIHRGRYILLFSPEFIEVRNVNSGRLVQVLEGEEIRLLSPIREKTDDVLVSMQGSRDDSRGVSHKFLELLETAEIQTPSSSGHELWAEWDMA